MSGTYEYYFNVPRAVRDTFKNAGHEIPIKSDTIRDTWDGEHGIEIAKFIDENKEKVGIRFKSSTEISPTDKLELMSRVMKWIDSSISTTYLLPENTDWKDIYSFILESHKKEVKSIAAFPDRKMYGIVSFIPFKELASKLLSEGVNIHSQNFSKEEQQALKMPESLGEKVTERHAPKRPKILATDVYSITVKNEKFVIAVGLLDNKPYEILGGKSNGLEFKKQSRGTMERIASGKYCLEIGEIVIEDFSKHFTSTEQTLFRLASTSLRHGCPLEFLIDQMHKASDDMFSFGAAIARVLKRYIPNGHKVTGKECPSCKSTELHFLEGCISCKCGWSKC